MPHPLFKTEIDAARVLLRAGWRPNDINGILQFPLSEEAFRSLGAHSLFFLVSDPSLAEERRPGAKPEAATVLAAHGWTDIEIDALLKPDRKFAPGDAFAYPSSVSSGSSSSDASYLWQTFDSTSPNLPIGANTGTRSNTVTEVSSPSGLQHSRPLRHYRRSMGLNRLLGLGLVIASVSIFACLLP